MRLGAYINEGTKCKRPSVCVAIFSDITVRCKLGVTHLQLKVGMVGTRKTCYVSFDLLSLKSSTDIASCHNISGEMLFSYECCQEKVALQNG